ncbi:MAG: 30S ribosome-binding factor RbfA [Gammaproteobacteria bacterium]
MPREFHRSSRVAQAIHRTLASLLFQQTRDPLLQQVTLTHVDVSRDLGVAKVHFTVRDPELAKEALAALAGGAGFLRREVSREVRLRTTPQLRFLYDESLERGERLTSLIEEARANDRAVSGDDPADGDGQS